MEKQNNTPATISSIQQFSFFNPEQFDTMQRVAKMFAKSELVPDMYKESSGNSLEKAVSNCIIAIDIANRIQANILMVMQNLVIIYGRPSWSSKFLIATVNTCGRFESLKFKFKDCGSISNVEYVEYEWNQQAKKKFPITKKFPGPVQNLECIAHTTVKGDKDVLESSPVSVEMAIKEGWYTKNGSKWPNMTKLMLMYRAASFWTSAYAPELSMGMKTEDEVRDIVDIEYEDVTGKIEKQAELEIKANANKTTIDIEDEKPEEKKADEAKPQPVKLDSLKVKDEAEARTFLHENFGVPHADMIREKVHERAKENGFDIVIDMKPKEPGF